MRYVNARYIQAIMEFIVAFRNWEPLVSVILELLISRVPNALKKKTAAVNNYDRRDYAIELNGELPAT